MLLSNKVKQTMGSELLATADCWTIKWSKRFERPNSNWTEGRLGAIIYTLRQKLSGARLLKEYLTDSCRVNLNYWEIYIKRIYIKGSSRWNLPCSSWVPWNTLKSSSCWASYQQVAGFRMFRSNATAAFLPSLFSEGPWRSEGWWFHDLFWAKESGVTLW